MIAITAAILEKIDCDRGGTGPRLGCASQRGPPVDWCVFQSSAFTGA